jgi:hypothetical protein
MKHNYLEVYLQEIEFKYGKYNAQFLKEYYEQNPDELKLDNPEPARPLNTCNIQLGPDFVNQDDIGVIPDTIVDDESSEFKTTLNKLYRKLSLKTHPDKNGGSETLFLKVSNAYKKKNILELIKIADVLKYTIDIDFTPDIIKNIETEIEIIERKIDELQHHVCWLWCNANEDTKKKFKLPR